MRRIQTYCFGILALCGATRVVLAAPKSSGIDVRVGPPQSHHNLDEYGTATVSWLERSVNFPGPGAVALNAFADSQTSDRLELLIDGVVKSSMSGVHRVGPMATQVDAG